MKHLFIFLLMSSFFVSLGFAEEIETECVMMQEHTVRNNPKANQGGEPKPEQTRSSSASVQ